LRLAPVVAIAIALIGCAHPPKISTALSVKRKSADTVAVVLKVRNLENRATTPILVSLTAELRTGDTWSGPQPIMNPVAFVLNRKEEHTITANLKTDAVAMRTMLTVKEAENGNLLKTERGQLAVPPT
jgi:hypothetical protein